MTFTDLFLAELDREANRTRGALQEVPAGKEDWSPHPRSMPLGRLAGLVASMPSWIPLIIDTPELDLNPPGGGRQYQQPATDSLVATQRRHGGQGARITEKNQRRLPDDDKLEAARERYRRQRSAAPCRAARHAEPPRAPSWPTDRVSPSPRSEGTGYLRAIGRRPPLHIDMQPFGGSVLPIIKRSPARIAGDHAITGLCNRRSCNEQWVL